MLFACVAVAVVGICSSMNPFLRICTELHKQDACVEDNSFVQTKNLQCGGWTDDEHLLFIRPEAAALWNKLNHFDKALHIEGPPGTGKSTIAWAWACAMAQQKDVLWVHRDHTGSGNVAHLGGNSIVSFQSETQDLREFVRRSSASVIIVDGVTKKSEDLMGACLVWRANGDDRHVVIVTSSQIVLPAEDYQSHFMSKYSMPSWTLKQYNSACDNEEFYQCVEARLGNGESKEEQVANKFFLAGASARWMFAFDCDTLIKQEIPTYIDELENMATLLSGMSGKRSATAVNHLCMVNKDRKGFIVSEYAMRLIAEKCELSFIAEASEFARAFKNPVFDGWVFEMDFLMQLRLSVKLGSCLINLFDCDGVQESWSVKSRESFYKVTDISAMKLEDDMWLIPQRWNQGGYDAVQVLDNKRLRFVQITRAAKHSLKLDYYSTLIKQVVQHREVASVEVVFVIPYVEEYQAPEVSSIRGSLEPWGWKPSALRVMRLKRSGSGQ